MSTGKDFLNVVGLPASTTFTPEQALHSALSLDLKEVLIIGYDQKGELAVRSSRMIRQDAIWLIEVARRYALEA